MNRGREEIDSHLINKNAIHEGIFVVKAKAGTTKGSLFDLRENNKSSFTKTRVKIFR